MISLLNVAGNSYLLVYISYNLSFLFQAKRLMEEAVTRRFVHADSSSVSSLCGMYGKYKSLKASIFAMEGAETVHKCVKSHSCEHFYLRTTDPRIMQRSTVSRQPCGTLHLSVKNLALRKSD